MPGSSGYSLKLASIRTAELPFFAHFSVVALKLPSTSVPVDAAGPPMAWRLPLLAEAAPTLVSAPDSQGLPSSLMSKRPVGPGSTVRSSTWPSAAVGSSARSIMAERSVAVSRQFWRC